MTEERRDDADAHAEDAAHAENLSEQSVEETSRAEATPSAEALEAPLPAEDAAHFEDLSERHAEADARAEALEAPLPVEDAAHFEDLSERPDEDLSERPDEAPSERPTNDLPAEPLAAHDRRRPVGSTAARKRRRSAAADRRRSATINAVNRTVGTIAGLGVLAGTVWALGWMPLPSLSITPQGMEVQPLAGDQVRVCAGPLQQLGLTNVAGQAVPVGQPTVTTVGPTASATPIGEQGPSSYVFPASDGEATSASIAQAIDIATDKTRGYTMTNCIQPAPTQWLSAGSTELGHTLVLDIVNPGAAPARVNFEAYGPSGAISPGIPEMVIPEGGHQQVSLAGIAPDLAAITLKITATGSTVAAFLHETITSTLQPVGIEVTGPTALPATTQVLPGMWIANRPNVDETDPTRLGTSVRVLNPGERVAQATMQLITADGAIAHELDLELEPGKVVNFPLGAVPEGIYTVRFDSDVPIVASGRVAPIDATEFASLAAPNPMRDREVVPVPAGDAPRLSIANPTDEARDIVVNGATHRIPAHGAVSVDVAAGEATIEGAVGMYAALHVTSNAKFASIPVLTGNPDAEPVTVFR